MIVALSPKLRWRQEGYVLEHYCPACKTGHLIPVAKNPNRPDQPIWHWNESLDRASFQGAFYQPTHQCHYTITNGKIAFCGDCGHEMSNHVVELPDFPAGV